MRRDERAGAELLRLQSGANGEENGKKEALIRALRRAVQEELTPRQRTCIALYFVDGLKMCEIAARLGIHPSAVTVHIRRGKKRLEKALRPVAEALRDCEGS